MTIQEYLKVLDSGELPNYFIICSTDTELRLVYLKLFCEAYNCNYKYVDNIEFKNRTRVLGKTEVLVLTDFKPVIEKPHEMYKEYSRPIVYMYTSPKGITTEIEKFYDNRVLVVSEITREQAENILLKKGLAEPAIQYFCENISNPTYVRRYGLQMLALCKDLNMDQQTCFETYYKEQVRADISEEPEPFFKAILTKDLDFVCEYLKQQSGNEFYVYAAIFRWLENLLRFLASKGDYWNKGGLVKAVYSQYQNNNWSNITYLDIIRLYDMGIEYRDTIKSTERDPLTALEVYTCCITQCLIDHQVI